MVLYSLTIAMVLMMVAFVMDLGPLYGERRQDQTAADAAALAGIQVLPQGKDVAAQNAMAVARSNLGQTYSDTEWSALWSGCADPERNATSYPVTAAASACISFNPAFTRMRVRLPDQLVKVSFAKAFGITQLRTHAVAEAQIAPPAGGGVMPLAADNFISDPKNQICLAAGSGCDGDNSDSLLAVDSPQLTTTPQTCRPTSYAGRIEANIAMGLDHFVVPWAGTLDAARDDDCGTQQANRVYKAGSGGVSSFLVGMRKGLITGPLDTGSNNVYPDGLPARLQRIPSVAGWPTRNLIYNGATIALDNRPLWEFIPPGTPAGVPSACYRANVVDETTMEACLNTYYTGGFTAPVFTQHSSGTPPGLYDIQLSPRVSFVPVVNSPTLGAPNPPACTSSLGPPASSSCTVNAFKVIYVETVYLTAADDAGPVFRPGEGGTSTLSMTSFDGISALKIFDKMLPATVVGTGVQGGLRGAAVSLVR
jgi:hypothetical protein